MIHSARSRNEQKEYRDGTHERVEEFARCIDFHAVHVAKTLDLAEYLQGEQRRPLDPLALTPGQEVILYQAGRELVARFETIGRDFIRRANFKDARRNAAEQWKRLELIEPSRRPAEIRGKAAFHTWSFCEYLCFESVREAARDPRRAIHIGRLAVVAARCVDLPWADRLVAYALAHLANALRVAGKHDEADGLFSEARRRWSNPAAAAADPGVLDPGRIFDLEASFRRDQRKLPETLALLQQALPISRVPGRILFKKALTLSLMGSYEEAIATLRRADALLTDREPRDEFVLHLNTGVNLCHLERFDEAAVLADAAFGIAGSAHNRIDILRSMWLRARVLAGRGERPVAYDIYQTLRREFDELGMTYDLALVSLELAALLLALGRTRECRSLAVGLPAYFEAKGIHKEALAALQVFSDSVGADAASEALARQIVAFLYLARGNQDLRFVPAGS